MSTTLFTCVTCDASEVGSPAGFCSSCHGSGVDGSMCSRCFNTHSKGHYAGHEFRGAAALGLHPGHAILAKFQAKPHVKLCAAHGAPLEFRCLVCNGNPLLCSNCFPKHLGHDMTTLKALAANQCLLFERALTGGGAGTSLDGTTVTPPIVDLARQNAQRASAESASSQAQASVDSVNAAFDAIITAANDRRRSIVEALSNARQTQRAERAARAQTASAKLEEALDLAESIRSVATFLPDVDVVMSGPHIMSYIADFAAEVQREASRQEDAYAPEVAIDTAPIIAAINGIGGIVFRRKSGVAALVPSPNRQSSFSGRTDQLDQSALSSPTLRDLPSAGTSNALPTFRASKVEAAVQSNAAVLETAAAPHRSLFRPLSNTSLMQGDGDSLKSSAGGASPAPYSSLVTSSSDAYHSVGGASRLYEATAPLAGGSSYSGGGSRLHETSGASLANSSDARYYSAGGSSRLYEIDELRKRDNPAAGGSIDAYYPAGGAVRPYESTVMRQREDAGEQTPPNDVLGTSVEHTSDRVRYSALVAPARETRAVVGDSAYLPLARATGHDNSPPQQYLSRGGEEVHLAEDREFRSANRFSTESSGSSRSHAHSSPAYQPRASTTAIIGSPPPQLHPSTRSSLTATAGSPYDKPYSGGRASGTASGGRDGQRLTEDYASDGYLVESTRQTAPYQSTTRQSSAESTRHVSESTRRSNAVESTRKSGGVESSRQSTAGGSRASTLSHSSASFISPLMRKTSSNQSINSVIAAAQHETARGRSPSPVPHRIQGPVVDGHYVAPCVTRSGTLYLPKDGEDSLHVIPGDGSPHVALPLAPLGLSRSTVAAAYDEPTGTLFLADSTRLVAVDPSNLSIRWSTPAGSLDDCYGIAVLPQTVIFAGSRHESVVHAYRVTDGTRLASIEAKCPIHIAVDAVSQSVFVSVGFGSCSVAHYHWDGSAFKSRGTVKAAGSAASWRPMAVIPPMAGQYTSHLVVGTNGSPQLRVLSLPDLQLVHEVTLDGMKVTGLVGHPTGEALIICDRVSWAVHVLPWPLQGV